MSESKFYQL